MSVSGNRRMVQEEAEVLFPVVEAASMAGDVAVDVLHQS